MRGLGVARVVFVDVDVDVTVADILRYQTVFECLLLVLCRYVGGDA